MNSQQDALAREVLINTRKRMREQNLEPDPRFNDALWDYVTAIREGRPSDGLALVQSELRRLQRARDLELYARKREEAT